ncbi:hypothetical protein HPB48_001603 [Haemaphysalis longicornis]|uniref:Uncharacterized protein n=1 Tax=Haemaphysalis longicornis TaxID=44386 RepID=A0A9J6FCA8_HAELO|nr:hypothetical protein HPB48_001603 [Haemaphysalis longicornis]
MTPTLISLTITYKLVLSSSDNSSEELRKVPWGNTSLGLDLDQLMAESAVSKTLAKFHNEESPHVPTPQWRRSASISCGPDPWSNFKTADSPYLFDVVSDPCETTNLARERSDSTISFFNITLVLLNGELVTKSYRRPTYRPL